MFGERWELAASDLEVFGLKAVKLYGSFDCPRISGWDGFDRLIFRSLLEVDEFLMANHKRRML